MPYGAEAYAAIEYSGDFDHSAPVPGGNTDGGAGFWWFGPGAYQNQPFAQCVIEPVLANGSE